MYHIPDTHIEKTVSGYDGLHWTKARERFGCFVRSLEWTKKYSGSVVGQSQSRISFLSEKRIIEHLNVFC